MMTTSSHTDFSTTTIPWQGFDHVAIMTHDLDATVHFYREVLGMQVGEIYEARGGKNRHCFIKPGPIAGQGLHFWEVPGAPLPPPLETLSWQQPTSITSGFIQHIAFTLPNEAAALTLRQRLHQHNVQVSEINDLGTMRDMTFLDNNGTMLEAIWLKK
jgi:catechol 2,3-dioxygenase-like lactoylglutathione lyase family enzyme